MYVAWRVTDRIKWTTPTCINTCKTGWKNVGRLIRFLVGFNAPFRVHDGDGCRGKRFTIGSIFENRRGRGRCTVVVGLRKDEESSSTVFELTDGLMSSIDDDAFAIGKVTPWLANNVAACCLRWSSDKAVMRGMVASTA